MCGIRLPQSRKLQGDYIDYQQVELEREVDLRAYTSRVTNCQPASLRQPHWFESGNGKLAIGQDVCEWMESRDAKPPVPPVPPNSAAPRLPTEPHPSQVDFIIENGFVNSPPPRRGKVQVLSAQPQNPIQSPVDPQYFPLQWKHSENT
jgi:hypothetical protein